MHKIQRLYQLCLENIVHNRGFWLHLKETYNANPFDSLPPRLEQDLLDTYVALHGLPGRNNLWVEQQDNWRLFITHGICRLSVTEFTDKMSLMHIATTCRNLKELELRDVNEVFPYLKTLGPCLTMVICLHIGSMAHITSACLKFIRNHCSNLRVLELKSCFLNDKAVGHLKHLATLTELDLRDTEVTVAGVSQVLKNNPQLRSLHHPEAVRALYKLHSARNWLMLAPAGGSTTYYRLRELEMELSCKDNAGMLSVIANTCPYLERVRIEFDMHASPYVLLPLAGLKYLAELDVQCMADTEHTSLPLEGNVCLFDGSIVPILESCGRNMHTLSLEGIQGMKMCKVEHCCTGLATLGLYYNTYDHSSFMVPSDKTACKPFPLLRRFMFGSNSGHNDFSATYLEWLLSNENLEELCLSGSPLFTEELFSKAFVNSKAFPCLRRLELDYCNVSADVITGFLYHCGRKSLRELSICGPFVREQASPALCYIICEKLDVQLEAYFYSFVKLKKRMVRYKQDVNFISSKCEHQRHSNQQLVHWTF